MPQEPTPRIHWPAEWCRHSATILIYPHNRKTFRPAAREQFRGVVEAICDGGDAVIVVAPEPVPDLEDLEKTKRLRVLRLPTNDSWARDIAPTFVFEEPLPPPLAKSSSLADPAPPPSRILVGLDWDFNAYGGPDEGCYWPCDFDRQMASTICSHLQVERRRIPLVLEGGSIHSDGCGTILTTEECLLHRNRNPSRSKTEIEAEVLHATGASKMIWLPQGLAHDDDTNGHIDNFACFVRPRHVVLAWTDDAELDTDNYYRCRAALAILEKETDADGHPLVIHKLLLPRPLFYGEDVVRDLDAAPEVSHTRVPSRIAGERLAASYVNFYIANDSVVVPQFGDDVYDAKAVETLQELFPDRRVVGVPSLEILYGGGNIHCITQQVPELP